MIAEDLGFRRDEVQFYGIESEDRARMEATDPEGNPVPVKMVIASYSITADREADAQRDVLRSPTCYTEQSVITLQGPRQGRQPRGVQGQEGLHALHLDQRDRPPDASGATLIRANRVSECFDRRWTADEVDAVTTDAAILAGFKAHDPGRATTTGTWAGRDRGVGRQRRRQPGAADLVNLTLYRSLKDPKDARWEQAYQNNLAGRDRRRT